MSEQMKNRDRSIAIIVVVAGLLSGAIITHHFLAAPQAPPASLQYPMAEGHRIPYDMIVAERENGDGQDADSVAEPGGYADLDHPHAEGRERIRELAGSTAAERKAVYEARQRLRAEGVEEYEELTEALFVEISAKMVVMAATLEKHPDAADPTAMQGLMGDYAAGLLAQARIDPNDFYEYTYKVHSDRERAEKIGERILREAEKYTDRRIDVRSVPGIEALPVPEAQDQ